MAHSAKKIFFSALTAAGLATTAHAGAFATNDARYVNIMFRPSASTCFMEAKEKFSTGWTNVLCVTPGGFWNPGKSIAIPFEMRDGIISRPEKKFETKLSAPQIVERYTSRKSQARAPKL